MAALTLVIRPEFDALHDQIDQTATLLEALASRHGDRFRALERRIYRLADADPRMTVENLGEGVFVPVSGEMAAILVDGRALGVI